MKIGILTFHCAHNYGAVLQAYALQEKLKELGHYVEIIDYRPSYLIDAYKIPSLNFKSQSIKNIVFKILSVCFFKYSRRKRFVKFDDFIKNKLNLHQQTNIIPEDYDLYILGSDQIWNGYITKGIDNVYWGRFSIKPGAKKITYAVSLGNYKLQEGQKPYVKQLLAKIDGISVREKETLSKIQSLANKQVYEVLDPTFLNNKLKWNKLINDDYQNRKYVLLYQVRYNKHLKDIAKNLAKQIKGTIIEVPAYISKQYIFNKYKTISPVEFISLIKNAECIVTSSFHGTAFSIIFEKPFYTVALNDGKDNRSINLLNKLSLQNRMINVYDNVKFAPIDYTESNKKLQYLIYCSESYLNSFINE
jgi:hypothetical protein